MATFEEEQVAFYIEYGKTLAAWTNFENALATLVRQFFPEGMPRAILGMGFTGIQGFQSKRHFADRCVERALVGHPNRKALQDSWAACMAHADSLSSKRNNLAHWITKGFPDYRVEGRRIALCPWYRNKSEPKDCPPSNGYCTRELIAIRREFIGLIYETLNFLRLVHGNNEPLLAPAELQGDLPTIQQIVDQIHEALGHPRLSAKEKRRMEEERNAAASLEVHIHVESEQGNGTEGGNGVAQDASHPAAAQEGGQGRPQETSEGP